MSSKSKKSSPNYRRDLDRCEARNQQLQIERDGLQQALDTVVNTANIISEENAELKDRLKYAVFRRPSVGGRRKKSKTKKYLNKKKRKVNKSGKRKGGCGCSLF